MVGKGPVIVPDELLDEARALYERAAAGETIVGHETRRLRRDGTQVDVSLSLAPLRGPDGDVRGIVGVLEDISERKRHEEELRRRNEELSALHETAVRLLAQEDARSVLETVVARGAALVGASSAMLYEVSEDGRTLTGTIAIGDAERFRGTTAERGSSLSGRVLETGRAEAVEEYSTWPGRIPAYEGVPLGPAAAVPIRVGSRIVGVLGVARDEPRPFDPGDLALLERFAGLASLVLERARIPERLAASEQRLRLAVEIAGVSVSETDFARGVTTLDELGASTSASTARCRARRCGSGSTPRTGSG